MGVSVQHHNPIVNPLFCWLIKNKFQGNYFSRATKFNVSLGRVHCSIIDLRPLNFQDIKIANINYPNHFLYKLT